MIRPATAEDTASIVALGVANAMFRANEAHAATSILDSVHAGQAPPEHQVHVLIRDGMIVGAVYFGPDPMTDRKWDVWMIAVDPALHNQGIGREMMGFAESVVRAAKGRLLLIDTSSKAQYDKTRAFYARMGYVEVARVEDFYAEGDGRVTYAKRMLG